MNSNRTNIDERLLAALTEAAYAAALRHQALPADARPQSSPGTGRDFVSLQLGLWNDLRSVLAASALANSVSAPVVPQSVPQPGPAVPAVPYRHTAWAEIAGVALLLTSFWWLA